MKKTIIKNIALSISAALMLSGCTTELDLENPTAFTLEDIISTEDGFLLLSNGILDAYQKVVSNEYLVLEARSDNAVSNTLIGVIADINSYDLTANEGNSANYYSNNYTTIARANQIIENRDLAPEEFQYTIGEAFFMRALCHFNAVRAFENVPYVDRFLDVASQEILEYPQLPPAEVYARIIDDFRTSIAFLQQSPSNSPYRPSEEAAVALLAKAYLSQPTPNYAEAEALLSSIIGASELVFTEAPAGAVDVGGNVIDPEYVDTLIVDYAQVFGNVQIDEAWDNTGNETNDEILFSIAFEANNAEDGDVTSADPDLDDQVETDSEIFSFDMSAGGQSNGVNIASLDFLGVMNSTDQPVRFEPTLIAATFNNQELDTETFQNKYPLESASGGRGNGNDWIIMRYADVLLLYAEAIMAGGDQTVSQVAIDAYNQVRSRAGIPTIGTGGALTKEALLEERRVEFAYENQRLFDLIRFGVADTVLSDFSSENSLNYTPPKKYLPFPQREIDATNGFYEQNLGY